MGLSSLAVGFDSQFATANTLSELEKQKKEVKNERETIGSDIEEAEEKIAELQAEQEKIHSEIRRLDMSITDTSNQVREKNALIGEKEQEIEQLKVEITELMSRIEKRNEVLKGRALSFQESGGVISYLDVLLGAQNFSDFIDRVTSVAAIMEADKSILNAHTTDKNALEFIQVDVEEQLASLEAMRAELEKMEANLKVQKAEKDNFVAKLQEEEVEVSEAKFTFEEEASILAAQEKAIESMIGLEKQRIKEEEARRKAEEEARRKAEAEAKKNNSSGGNSSVATAPPISSGTFTNPAAGRFTSGFGPRWGSFHYGIDIAQRGSGVPIVAAASGVVFTSYYSTSYGNVIFVRHNVDGQVYTTVYAHLDSRHVSTGDIVSKGQQIGYMGNTGNSFGQHLHFELHRGDWNARKSNAINPLEFLNY